ncbi:MAG: glycosyltransferase family 4 protein [Bradymonadales bacterium]|nr:glycosyltransferase family 4 protein [Bradymonadales bacterium]
MRAWSGSVYHIWRSLADRGFPIELVGPLTTKHSFRLRMNKLRAFLVGKRFLRERDPAVLRELARSAEAELSGKEFDVILSPGTLPITHLRSARPIVTWTDATFDGMVNYYPGFRRLAPQSLKDGHSAEELALARVSAALYASQWAADSAVRSYTIHPDKVAVVPFGAHLESQWSLDEVGAAIGDRDRHLCHLLFVGVDWWRKGGDIAVRVTRELIRLGIRTRLHVVGCPPPLSSMPEFIDPVGFVDPSTESGRKRMGSLFAQAHFLLLPTRAECYGLVFCEASSFGVPSLAPDTGGVSTPVVHGVNGFLFNRCASHRDYARTVANLFTNWTEYRELALASYQEYLTRLNWRVAGEAAARRLVEVAGGSR